jgi:DNA-binding CsgD family transcriptional regulator
MDTINRSLDTLYDAASGGTEWEVALSQLASLLGGVGGTSGMYNLDTPYADTNCESSVGKEFISAYYKDFASDSPTFRQMRNLPPASIVSAEDIMGEAAFRQTRFYRSLMRPFGLARIISANTSAPVDGVVTAAAFYRSPSQPGFTDTDRQLFAHLMSHINRALRLRDLIHSTRARGDMALNVLDAENTGILFVSRTGEIIGGNQTGEHYLHGNLFTSFNGHIQTLIPAETAALHRAIRFASGQIGPGAANEKVGITGPEGKRINVEVVPAHYSGNDRSASLPAIALILKDAGLCRKSAWITLQTLFGLTASEMKVIRSLTESDLPHAEIAETLGISVNTFKSHRMRAYQKLGVTSHASLIKMISDYR